jgi:hypothetical protein
VSKQGHARTHQQERLLRGQPRRQHSQQAPHFVCEHKVVLLALSAASTAIAAKACDKALLLPVQQCRQWVL